jgi:hypothetical protein
MGDYYDRTTRECRFDQLRPELATAIREYVEKHQLGDIEAEILLCCETTSERKKRQLLGRLLGLDRDRVTYTAALVTPSLLVWAQSGAKSGTWAVAARLGEIEVRDYETTPQAQVMADTGLEVFGFLLRSGERGTTLIGLGSETAARRFREAVQEAVGKAKGG